MSRRDEILNALKQVDLLSSPSIGALQMLSDLNVESEKLARIIELDAALTANVLRYANSAYFGCTQPVCRVKDAFVRLGVKTISRMVYMSVVSQVAPQQVRGYDLEPGVLWNHLVAAAVSTDLLAEQVGVTPPSSAFTAALLHDIGKLVLGNNVRINVQPILQLVRSDGLSFEEAERAVLGTDQAEVGAELLRLWNLPDSIADAVQYHLTPDQYTGGHQDVVDLLHVSNIVASCYGSNDTIEGFSYTICPGTERRLGIGAETFEEIMTPLETKIRTLNVAG